MSLNLQRERALAEKTVTYRVPEIPDPLYPQYQIAAGGDVLSAAVDDFEHLLRTVANMPVGSVSVCIRLVFSPKKANRDMQSRLRVFMIAHAHDENTAEGLRLLLEHGPLSRFYRLENVKEHQISIETFSASCEILRREDAIKPLHPPELNYKIPDYYYTILPFKPNERNDYVMLDRVLDDIHEEITIDIRIQPYDVSSELSEHTSYLSLLQSINRTWDLDEDEEQEVEDFLGDDPSSWRSTWGKGIKPLRNRDPLADEILRSQQRFHESLRKPHLLFRITVLTETPAVAQLLGSVVAESAFEEGSYRLITSHRGEKVFDEGLLEVKGVRITPRPAHDLLFSGTKKNLYPGLTLLSRAAPVDELLGVFRLPLASAVSPNCIRENTDHAYEDEQKLLVLGRDQGAPKLERGPSPSQTSEHLFFSGGTGSGKTTSVRNLCIELHRREIPFLILEPTKTEYRVLKTFRDHPDKNICSLAEEIEIYTPGDESVSPLRLNPLELLPGIGEDEHIDNLLSCFKAAMPVEGSLPALLGEACEKVYEDNPDRSSPPIMADLVKAVERVLIEKGYSPDTSSDFRAAIEARLGVLTRRSVGRIFQCRKSIPGVEELMKVPAVIEFDRLHKEQSALLILFYLTGIREFLKTAPKSEKNPRYVIILEEAHNILGKTQSAVGSPDIADPKAFATEYIVRMLAEYRGLGVGIVIVDQLPSAIAPEVTKITSTKLAFRQVDKEDREVIGDSMLLSPTEKEELARMETGGAFFFTVGYNRARRIRTTNLHEKLDLDRKIPNEKILPWISGDSWYQRAALKRIVSDFNLLRESMDRFDKERLGIMHKFVKLRARFATIYAGQEMKVSAGTLRLLKDNARGLREKLSVSYRSFLKNSYRKLLPPDEAPGLEKPDVMEMRDDLLKRFQSITRPDSEGSLQRINEFIDHIQSEEERDG